MELVSSQLAGYVDGFVPPRPPEMRAMEAYAKRTGFPIIGPACGHLCYQIARLIDARRIFELGSGYGYSAAWFAKAVQENGGGTVYHVDRSKELTRKAQKQLLKLGFGGIIEYHVGEAIDKLREVSGTFDLIFNDIDKHEYPNSLPLIREKLRLGGVLIVDNMLWGGRIFDASDQSEATQGVREFTRQMKEDPGWIISLIPIRDGMIVAYRK